MIIDTHAHLYWEDFQKDFDEVIKRALDAGVTQVINIGVDVDTSIKAAQMQNDKIKFHSSIGIHPHEVLKYFELRQKHDDRHKNVQEDIDALEKIYLNNSDKVVAVGECGLDFKEVDEQTKNLQKKLFQAQIDLAKKLNLPLLVHCRDDRSQNPSNSEAWDEVLDMIGGYPAILHCYSGLPPTTNYILRTTNLMVSFAGNSTYSKNAYLREAIKILPLERIVLETDCPFLPPQSKRGTRNEPAFMIEVLKTVAEIKQQDITQIEEIIYQNSLSILKNKYPRV